MHDTLVMCAPGAARGGGGAGARPCFFPFYSRISINVKMTNLCAYTCSALEPPRRLNRSLLQVLHGSMGTRCTACIRLVADGGTRTTRRPWSRERFAAARSWLDVDGLRGVCRTLLAFTTLCHLGGAMGLLQPEIGVGADGRSVVCRRSQTMESSDSSLAGGGGRPPATWTSPGDLAQLSGQAAAAASSGPSVHFHHSLASAAMDASRRWLAATPWPQLGHPASAAVDCDEGEAGAACAHPPSAVSILALLTAPIAVVLVVAERFLVETVAPLMLGLTTSSPRPYGSARFVLATVCILSLAPCAQGGAPPAVALATCAVAFTTSTGPRPRGNPQMPARTAARRR